ncbi:arylsulfatase [Roseomonas nepalensis]|uniref:Arylsulfatase n=1 Tax=Muricoccus nepalensis TaxID=1854500 RepID=A0A502F465_9PROT|nr:aspartate/glutamate racemase family protein [Roseomonas nepalensis]TPG44823.1 arylsulfatase [Roseomonas nepalensis]
MSGGPRIALIHAVAAAIPPVHAAFAQGWPEARLANLFDDSLPSDLSEAGALTPAIAGRIGALARYMAGAGAEGILFTCSAFGPAIEAAARALSPFPVLKPNEAMFEEALGAGERIGMLATFGPAVAGMEEEFRQAAGGRSAARLETVLAEGAIEALKAGDAAAHDRLVAEAVPRLARCDAIMLAHFSTSRALGAAQAAMPGKLVLAAPGAAVAALRRRFPGR